MASRVVKCDVYLYRRERDIFSGKSKFIFVEEIHAEGTMNAHHVTVFGSSYDRTSLMPINKKKDGPFTVFRRQLVRYTVEATEEALVI